MLLLLAVAFRLAYVANRFQLPFLYVVPVGGFFVWMVVKMWPRGGGR